MLHRILFQYCVEILLCQMKMFKRLSFLWHFENADLLFVESEFVTVLRAKKGRFPETVLLSCDVDLAKLATFLR